MTDVPVQPADLKSAAAGAMPDQWPLQADRAALGDPLVACLSILAGYYGRRTSRETLTAGLPIPKSGITPALMVRAAERAHLDARLVDRTIDGFAIAPNVPCILVLEHGQACIVWDVQHPHKNPPRPKPGETPQVHADTAFVVQFPETASEKKTISIADLRRMHAGYIFYVRPVARVDDRAGPAKIGPAQNWFWSTIWQNRKIYYEVALAALMINLFAIALPLYTMNIYDRVVPNVAYETLAVLSVGLAVVLLFDLIIKSLRAHFLDYAGRKSDVKLSAKLFEQMLGMTMAARPASAGVLAANMREFESIRDFFTSATLAALIDLPFTLLFILIIAVIAGPLALVPLIAVPLILGAGWILQRPMKKIIQESLHENALKNALLFETITGLETIKTQAAEGHVQRRWEELAEKSSRTSVKSKRVSNFAMNFSYFLQNMVTIGLVAVGVYLIANAQITMGALIAAVMLSSRALAPLTQFSGLMIRFNQTRESLRQLNELMEKPVERPASKTFISMPSLRGQVEFKDVVFAYPGASAPALNHINFSVQPGEKIGIIGAVGSGKTTLERLILNKYEPQSGSVQIDGSDVRQIDPGDLRRNVGVVQQSPQLFYGSVRENITMGHETAPDRAVVRAAELAGVMDFLKDSAHGLDTQVGERGEQLSGGQRQAIAIARALLYDPPVLILDEPTASMDPASEARLKVHLEALTRDKTTLLITHKGSMLSLVDKIVLMDRGKVLAFGPRDEIIRKLQARDYAPGANAGAGAGA